MPLVALHAIDAFPRAGQQGPRREQSDNQSARQVSTQEGQALAAEYDVRFIEASAKADVNVTEAFQAIAQQVIDRIPRGMSRPASRQLSSKKSSKKSCSC